MATSTTISGNGSHWLAVPVSSSFEKRPAKELYDLRKDPHQLENVAGRVEYRSAQRKLRDALDRWMRETADPRATSDDDR